MEVLISFLRLFRCLTQPIYTVPEDSSYFLKRLLIFDSVYCFESFPYEIDIETVRLDPGKIVLSVISWKDSPDFILSNTISSSVESGVHEFSLIKFDFS